MTGETNSRDDVIEIDLQELMGLIVHWLWLILGVGVIAAVVGFCISFFIITPKYESTTSVYILDKKDNNTLTYSDTQLATQLTKDYEALITSRFVLEQVIEDLGIDYSYQDLADAVTVDNTTDTRIINITVKNESPAVAQYLANAVRDVSAEHIKSVMDTDAVNIVDEANLPESPSEPSVIKWTVIGFLLGAFICAAILVVRFLLDDTIKSSEDIERYLGLSTLGLIPDSEIEMKKKKKQGVRTGHEASEKGEHEEHVSHEEESSAVEAADEVEAAD